MAEILEILVIQYIRDLNWFNGPIINILTHIRSIIKVLFFDNFCGYLIEMENKIKQLLAGLLINKFKRFFKKAYKIRAAAAIPGLSRLIHNDPSIDLIWTQFCRNG